MKSVHHINTGLSPESNISSSIMDGNGVLSTGAWKANVTFGMCTFNLIGNNNDIGSNCLSDCSHSLLIAKNVILTGSEDILLTAAPGLDL